MASRQEEKEKRRQERLEAEREQAKRAERSRRLRLATGGVLALALVAAVVIAVAAGSSGKKAGGGSSATPELRAAAKAAGCTLTDYPKSYEDRGHTTGKVKYKTNPPAFGMHNPTPSSDGDYRGQGTPQPEHLVHSLEHGRIEVQYRPGLPAAQVQQLGTVLTRSAGPYGPGDYLLLFQNETKMPYAVAAVAWTHILGCKQFNPRVIDAIRAFRVKYTLKGPEFINQAE
jgi:hypothetical protein